MSEKNLEMIVIPENKGIEYPIFSHVQYYHYETPPGFNWDSKRKVNIHNYVRMIQLLMIKVRSYIMSRRKQQVLLNTSGLRRHTIREKYYFIQWDQIFNGLMLQFSIKI